MWKVGAKPRYLLRKAADNTTTFDTIDVSPLAGLESGEALLLHAALIAKTRGKRGFMVMPFRKNIEWSRVLFVNPDDPGIPADAVFDVEKVIVDLSPAIPAPAVR